jgi:asparagine synthase (glutamine-hydrolysing)
MCGIYCIFNYSSGYKYDSSKLSNRGPDDSKTYIDSLVQFHFYRLSINGISNGAQPMEYKKYILMCNGEIYNHTELEKLIDYTSKTGSDCEIILPLFEKFGIEKTCSLLDGVFAFTIWDTENKKLYVARDRFGVRPLFYASHNDQVQISSEIKGLTLTDDMCSDCVNHVPPAHYAIIENNKDIVFNPYYVYAWNENILLKNNINLVYDGIKQFLHTSVKKRMMTERPVGCLLSGGLDSSLIASLVRYHLPKDKQLRTFSIGFEGSPDLLYAKKVADFLQSDHHEFLVTPEEFLDHINEVIAVTETYDITTIRASVGNYLVCKKIKEYNQTQIPENQSIVIFNGDGADEVAGGYLYHRKAPSGLDFHFESVNLLKEIGYFDVLRSDRSCSDNGLEPRTPFLDRDFVNFYMSIPIEYRFDNTKQEKYLIREAFKNDNLLPVEVLFRLKEAFSDGISIREKSWWQIIHEYLEDKVTIPENIINYPFDVTKLNKESYYYYKTYSELYKNQTNVIPHYWLPKWSGNITNPSARVLSEYK